MSHLNMYPFITLIESRCVDVIVVSEEQSGTIGSARHTGRGITTL